MSLWNFNTNTPGLVAHDLRTAQPKSGASHCFVFGFNKPSDAQAFREEVAIDLWENGDFSYTYSWGLPGGEFKERSGVRMSRLPGSAMTLNHIHLGTKNLAAIQKFYVQYFGFKKKFEHGEGVFIEDDKGFLIAIDPVSELPNFPDWYHLGFCQSVSQ